MKRATLLPVLFTLASAACGWGQSAWLPLRGQFIATPGFSYSTFDEFWVGRDRKNPLEANDESLDQYTGFVALEYGMNDRLAADLTIGYTATSEAKKTFGRGSDEGLADTSFGLRYRLADEEEIWPTIALRAGGIIAGTYDANKPFSAGDGANGFETSLLLGKRFGNTGFGAYGDIGYRLRESPVPNDAFGSVGLFKQFPNVFADLDAITLSFGYRHIQSLSGQDIGDPGFTFPQLKEINQLIEGAVGYTDPGGRQYQFSVAKSVAGRNTGDKLVFLFTISLPFDAR
jgi:hypothetical protein